MKKVIKWGAILAGVFIALIIAALLIIPRFVDIQKYKPEIEKKVAEATGRPFALGGDLHLSLFPWAGISCSDIRLGNPPGFTEKEFVTVESMEMRVKLVPLISKDIQGRFILNGPRIVLERRKDGRGNWEGIAKPSDKTPAEPKKEKAKTVKGSPLEGLPIASLAIEEFAITDGYVLWIDHAKGERKELTDATIRLKDVSFDQPIHLDLAARLDGRPLALKGEVGPLGKEPGKGRLPLDISFKALDQIDLSMKGEVVDPASRQQFDLAINVSPFSPRKLMAALGQTFPVTTADPEALNRVAFKAKLKGDIQAVQISEGLLDLDESKLAFSLQAADFSKPDVTFDFNLDQIDLDRYLPPPDKKKPGEKKVEAAEKKKIDYAPLRKLVLDGTVRVGKAKAQGTRIQDFYLKVAGKDGRFRLDPLSLRIDEGDVSVIKGSLDVRQDTPAFDLSVKISPFSPRKLLAALGKDMPVKTADPTALSRVALKADVKGNANSVTVSGGDLALDESNLKFSVKAKDLSKPDVAFDLNLDQIDLDRYLPPPDKKKPGEKKVEAAEKKKIDYAPLRKLVLDGTVRVGKAKAQGTRIQDFYLKVAGKDGRFRLDPLSLRIDEGDVSVIKGSLDVRQDTPAFDLSVKISPFSPRKLLAALGKDMPVKTADPTALSRVALKADVKGNANSVTVSGGTLDLDESKLLFSATAKDLSKPDVAFDLNLDQIDLDRYLPPPDKKKPEEKEKAAETEKKKIDYKPLRRLVLDGTVRVGKAKAHGAKIQNLLLKVSGKNGQFNLDPLTLKLYQGNVSSKGALDVRQDAPKSNLGLKANGIQVGPLLKDLLNKDFLEGALQSDMEIRMIGDDPAAIKRTLNGKGNLLFTDGAIVGYDLAGMVRNTAAAFGLAEKTTEKPRTDFSELHAPFTITNGVVNTPGTSLSGPLVRLMASGKANLVNESLDFRVEPKFVATLKGQGDAKQRSGLMVPVLVSGTFSDPKFRPDLKGMLTNTLKEGLPDTSSLKKLIPIPGIGGTQQEETSETLKEPEPLKESEPLKEKEEPLQPLKDKVEGLFKSLPFGK
ncbi:AsmA family protein [Thermodesulfobacteriota bacterium]